jgi:hypothetical protein
LLHAEGERLRLVDPATGRRLPWSEEESAARAAAEARAAEEAAAREAAETRAAAAETQATQEAAAREAAEARAAAAEERIRLLEEELIRLHRDKDERGVTTPGVPR